MKRMRLLLDRVEEANHGVTAEPEDHFDAEAFEVIREQVRRDPRVGFRRGRLTAVCAAISMALSSFRP
jgi:hypothetical protein